MQDFSKKIQENRFHSFTVTHRINGKNMTIRQLRHKFLFGSNIFGLTRKEGDNLSLYRERIRDIWNAGTLPFYWGRFEPEEGSPDPENRVYDAAKWAHAEGFTLKGHPLCWHTVCADWLMKYDNDTILDKQLDRIRRDVDRFKPYIRTWDVVNEAVIMPVFNKYDNAVTRIAKQFGTVNLVIKCFKTVREVDPDATLLLNDFDLSPAYERLLEELLDKGCPIDVIGLQTHQHEGYRRPEVVADYLERFSRFGLPLHFTENTIISGDFAPKVDDLNDIHKSEWPSTPEGEARQKEQVEEFYSQIYAHPQAGSIVWWDIEDGNWLNAPAGLLRKDLSRKPAYDRLMELIKGEWWFTEQSFATDRPAAIRAPEGDYEAVIDGTSYPFTLDRTHPDVIL